MDRAQPIIQAETSSVLNRDSAVGQTFRDLTRREQVPGGWEVSHRRAKYAGGSNPPPPQSVPVIALLTYSPYTCRVLTGEGPARKRGPGNFYGFVRSLRRGLDRAALPNWT